VPRSWHRPERRPHRGLRPLYQSATSLPEHGVDADIRGSIREALAEWPRRCGTSGVVIPRIDPQSQTRRETLVCGAQKLRCGARQISFVPFPFRRRENPCASRPQFNEGNLGSARSRRCCTTARRSGPSGAAGAKEPTFETSKQPRRFQWRLSRASAQFFNGAINAPDPWCKENEGGAEARPEHPPGRGGGPSRRETTTLSSFWKCREAHGGAGQS